MAGLAATKAIALVLVIGLTCLHHVAADEPEETVAEASAGEAAYNQPQPQHERSPRSPMRPGAAFHVPSHRTLESTSSTYNPAYVSRTTPALGLVNLCGSTCCSHPVFPVQSGCAIDVHNPLHCKASPS